MPFRSPESQRKHYAAQSMYLDQIKDRPCADCGQWYPPYVMDLDHVRGEKSRAVRKMVGKVGMQRLVAEVAKCDVVCANCHRIRTHARRGNHEH